VALTRAVEAEELSRREAELLSLGLRADGVAAELRAREDEVRALREESGFARAQLASMDVERAGLLSELVLVKESLEEKALRLAELEPSALESLKNELLLEKQQLSAKLEVSGV
jgi:hypothetical protein